MLHHLVIGLHHRRDMHIANLNLVLCTYQLLALDPLHSASVDLLPRTVVLVLEEEVVQEVLGQVLRGRLQPGEKVRRDLFHRLVRVMALHWQLLEVEVWEWEWA
jgi:hypothetical protein